MIQGNNLITIDVPALITFVKNECFQPLYVVQFQLCTGCCFFCTLPKALWLDDDAIEVLSQTRAQSSLVLDPLSFYSVALRGWHGAGGGGAEHGAHLGLRGRPCDA